MSETKGEYAPKFAIEGFRLVGRALSRLLWRIEFKNIENIPKDSERGLLVTPNHQTYFDPVWVCLPIERKLRFMAWDEAFEWFFVGKMIRYMGAFPVNLDRGSKSSFKEALKVLRDGATLVIFPEGAREFADGKMLPFKTGAVKIAQRAGVPILPVTIRGGNEIWGRGMNFPKTGKVEIIYHPAIEIPNPSDKDEADQIVEETTERIRRIIESAM